jgi:hypothetical protein
LDSNGIFAEFHEPQIEKAAAVLLCTIGCNLCKRTKDNPIEASSLRNCDKFYEVTREHQSQIDQGTLKQHTA